MARNFFPEFSLKIIPHGGPEKKKYVRREQVKYMNKIYVSYINDIGHWNSPVKLQWSFQLKLIK